MNKGCKHYVGEIIRGLKIISEPYKVDGNRNYFATVKCEFCGKEYDTVLSEIKRHIFDGCGCIKNRSNSKNWYSFQSWCQSNDSEYLLDLWDTDLNTKSPNEVSSCTSDQYYFKCDQGIHSSELHKPLVLTRIRHVKTICRQCNSIAQHLINKFGDNALGIYWDYEKNVEDPWIINYGTKDAYWIKCANGIHKSYCRPFQQLIRRDIGCPLCALEKGISGYQEKTFNYIKNTYGYEIKTERSCSIIAKNPQTGYDLPYDNDIYINDQHLIIEVNGEQHYNNNWFSKMVASQKNVSSDIALKQQQYRDKVKMEYVQSLNNYHYLVLPYWTFQNDEYKTLIDNKISEILSLTTKTNIKE